MSARILCIPSFICYNLNLQRVFSFKIVHLPCFKILQLNPVLMSILSMKIPEPTLSEMHSKQPSHSIGKLRVNREIPKTCLKQSLLQCRTYKTLNTS